MDKFLVTNRFKNLGAVTDMSCIRHVFLKVQDMLASLDHFLLETYVLPSSYQEMSRRMIKERLSCDDPAVATARRKNPRASAAPMRQSQHVWVLTKHAEGKDGRKAFVVDPDNLAETARMYDYMPCVAQRQLKNPLTYD